MPHGAPGIPRLPLAAPVPCWQQAVTLHPGTQETQKSRPSPEPRHPSQQKDSDLPIPALSPAGHIGQAMPSATQHQLFGASRAASWAQKRGERQYKHAPSFCIYQVMLGLSFFLSQRQPLKKGVPRTLCSQSWEHMTLEREASPVEGRNSRAKSEWRSFLPGPLSCPRDSLVSQNCC